MAAAFDSFLLPKVPDFISYPGPPKSNRKRPRTRKENPKAPRVEGVATSRVDLLGQSIPRKLCRSNSWGIFGYFLFLTVS